MKPITNVRNTAKSTVAFGVLGAYYVIFGVLYLLVPIAPYHREFIGMTASEFASAQPSLYALQTALVDVAGLSFLAIAIAVFVFGRDAPTRPTASLALVGILAVYTVPVTYVVFRIDGPVVLASIPSVVHFAGLGLLYTEKEWTLGGSEAAS